MAVAALSSASSSTWRAGCGVVGAIVHVLSSDAAAAHPSVTVDAVAWTADLAEGLDVDVQELARVAASIPVGWLGRLEPRALPEPIRVSTVDAVESGIAKHSVISAAVICSRPSAATAAFRFSGALRHPLRRRGAVD
jgi:hypothetical protein